MSMLSEINSLIRADLEDRERMFNNPHLTLLSCGGVVERLILIRLLRIAPGPVVFSVRGTDTVLMG